MKTFKIYDSEVSKNWLH